MKITKKKSTQKPCVTKKHLTSDYHIFVFNVYIGNIDDKDVEKFIDTVSENLSLDKEFDNVRCYFIPVRDDSLEPIVKIW